MQDKKCILAIDDTAMQLHALVKILQPKYNVKVAKDGASGISYLNNQDIDLVLLDLIMPEMSGLEVLESLKSSDLTKNIPVILASGSTSEEDKTRGFALGAIGYIKKPFEENIVLQEVEKALR